VLKASIFNVKLIIIATGVIWLKPVAEYFWNTTNWML